MFQTQEGAQDRTDMIALRQGGTNRSLLDTTTLLEAAVIRLDALHQLSNVEALEQGRLQSKVISRSLVAQDSMPPCDTTRPPQAASPMLTVKPEIAMESPANPRPSLPKTLFP